tara:strand:- start:1371 stop:1916 length:546 start_codon:yes stop_codon:yes gene_type:complete
MDKIPVQDCIAKDHYDLPPQVREKILSLIADSDDPPLDDGTSLISKYDFDFSFDFDRDWVEVIKPHLFKALTKTLDQLGYLDFSVDQIWYQQYEKGSNHVWHIHGRHFTGVYYLEFPSGSAPTQVVSPYTMKAMTLDCKEGDLIVFPSHWTHRGMKNTSDRKTIISYNINIHRCIPEELIL